jgi:hypothetical protein
MLPNQPDKVRQIRQDDDPPVGPEIPPVGAESTGEHAEPDLHNLARENFRRVGPGIAETAAFFGTHVLREDATAGRMDRPECEPANLSDANNLRCDAGIDGQEPPAMDAARKTDPDMSTIPFMAKQATPAANAAPVDEMEFTIRHPGRYRMSIHRAEPATEPNSWKCRGDGGFWWLIRRVQG